MIASKPPTPVWRNPLWWALVLAGLAILAIVKGLGFADGWWFW